MWFSGPFKPVRNTLKIDGWIGQVFTTERGTTTTKCTAVLLKCTAEVYGGTI